MPTPIFGIDVPASTAGRDPIARARAAERLGFDFISTNDHVLGTEPRSEAWTLMCWLAASTSRIQVASRVIGVPYREPALLAKMAESFDRLSGRRLILGLGAGSGEAQYRAMGLEAGTVGERVTALEEAIEILRGLWSKPDFSFAGRRYSVANAQMEPKPARRIPIWLGTAGERGLELVGRVADGWIPSLGYVPPAQTRTKIQAIIAAAREAGREPAEIARIYNLEVSFGPARNASVSGSSDEIAEQLIGFTRLGFTGFNFQPIGPDPMSDMRRLAAEVVPAVRAAA